MRVTDDHNDVNAGPPPWSAEGSVPARPGEPAGASGFDDVGFDDDDGDFESSAVGGSIADLVGGAASDDDSVTDGEPALPVSLSTVPPAPPLDPDLDLVEVLEQQLDIPPAPVPEPVPVIELLGTDALRQDRRANVVAAAVAGAGVLAVVITGLFFATGPAPIPVAQSGTGTIFSSTSPFGGGGSSGSGDRTGTAGEGPAGSGSSGGTGSGSGANTGTGGGTGGFGGATGDGTSGGSAGSNTGSGRGTGSGSGSQGGSGSSGGTGSSGNGSGADTPVTTPGDPLPGTGVDPSPGTGEAANPAPALPEPDSPFLPPEPTPEPTDTPTPTPTPDPPADGTGDSQQSDETVLPPVVSPSEGQGDCQLVICVGE